MHDNLYKNQLVNLNLPQSLTRSLLIVVALLSLFYTQSYAQLPPAPPEFTSLIKLQSPKAVSSTSGSIMAKPPSAISLAVSIPTNHVAPSANFEWHIIKGGPYGVPDSTLTNLVGCLLTSLSNGIHIQHLGIQGKTYEIQVNFGFPDTNWWVYTRLTMPKDDLVTTGHPIYLKEKQRFFRVRSN